MIRNLAMIAIAGFVLSIACITAAIAIGGPDATARSAWSMAGRGWVAGWNDDDWKGHHGEAGGAHRQMAWTGGDKLTVDIPADVTYTQAPGPARLLIDGPAAAVNDIVIRDGVLTFAHQDHRHTGDLQVAMTAPNIDAFELNGSNKLRLTAYDQPKLAIGLSGDARVEGSGRTDALAVDISGSADADLSDLKATNAAVQISGSGEAKIAPTGTAKVDISGSGNVYLTTRPARLDSDVSGSGQIHQGDDD